MDFTQTLFDILGGKDAKNDQKSPKNERDFYQEALVTELLRLLVANSIITKDEAQGVVRRARETAKDRASNK